MGRSGVVHRQGYRGRRGGILGTEVKAIKGDVGRREIVEICERLGDFGDVGYGIHRDMGDTGGKGEMRGDMRDMGIHAIYGIYGEKNMRDVRET